MIDFDFRHATSNSRLKSNLASFKFLRLEQLELRSMLAVGDLLFAMDDASSVPQAAAEFGDEVAIDGDYVVVSAPSDDNQGGFNTGSVHVFGRTSNNLLRSVVNPSPSASDGFGRALDISGNLMLVGAPLSDIDGPDSGRAYVFDVTTGALISTLRNPAPNPFDFFGSAVALHGSLAVVGAYLDDTAATDAGAVHVFDATSGTLRQTIVAPNAQPFESGGFAVATNGGVIAMSSHRADTSQVDAGVVRLFDAVTFAHLRTIENPTPATFDYFGYALSLSDTRLAVGAYRDDTGASDAGAAYTFDLAAGLLEHTFLNPTPANSDNFGFAVALSADVLLVGAYRDDTGAFNSGAAYQFSASSGTLQRTFNNPTPASTDYFGAAVAASAQTLVVGAYGDDTGASDAGAAYLIDAVTGTVTSPLTNPTISSFDNFGSAVAVSDTTLAVGSPLDDSTGTDSGAVYLYDTATGALRLSISNPTPAAYDNFGSSVAIMGNLLLVGAYRDDAEAPDAGAAYLFDVPSGALLRTILNPAAASFDYFGFSVALSHEIIVVGAPRDDTGAVDAGAVYVFDTGTALLLESIENPTPQSGDQFGFAVSLDANSLVVGAPLDDTSSVDNGIVYVFDPNEAQLTQTLLNPSVAANELFGSAVGSQNGRAVIGAPQFQVANTATGIAHVFDVGTGQLQFSLLSPNANDENEFGSAVAVSDRWIVIGAPNDRTVGLGTGAAYVFDFIAGQFLTGLSPATSNVGDRIGHSVAICARYLAVGAPLVDGLSTDRGAAYVFSATDAQPIPPPLIDAIVVGDGSRQRSMVDRIQIQFDSEVQFDPGAFNVQRTVGVGLGTVQTVVSSTLVDGRTTVTVRFTGSFTVSGSASLKDGTYRLTIDGDRIRRAGTLIHLDADADGEAGGIRLFGAQTADNFFRLFGDVDGDRDVDTVDRAAFFAAFGHSNPDPRYDPRFDSDGDGDVDGVDRLRFLQNLRLSTDDRLPKESPLA